MALISHDFVDESLYSRQIYAIGVDAMKKLAHQSRVLVSGLDGVGEEIAKNIILAGVKSVVLHDQRRVSWLDLNSCFYLSEKDLSKNRASACVDKFRDLNPYVSVTWSDAIVTNAFLAGFQCVVLCDWKLNEKLLALSDFCHRQNIRLVLAKTCGLFGQLFCDFGDKFQVVDSFDRDPRSCFVESIEGDVVTLVDDKSSQFLPGTLVSLLSAGNGNNDKPVYYRVNKLLSRSQFSIDITEHPIPSGNVSSLVATEVRLPRTIKFKPLKEAIRCPNMAMVEQTAVKRQLLLHRLFWRLPLSQHQKGSENELIIREFKRQQLSKLGPMAAVIGGIAAQEVIKSLTGKYNPIEQFFYFDALGCLSATEIPNEDDDFSLEDSRYDSQIMVFGRNFQNRLADLNLFLVGSGAIGCEMLKNWAMMGVACSPEGSVTVTDMDLIERSNLNRQFLFRTEHIKQPKSQVAAKMVKAMNATFNVTAHENRVGTETESIYNDAFFRKIDVVVTGLDSVPARVYLDSRCVFFEKPMFDSGTFGPNGSTSVFLPNVTDCYSSKAPKSAAVTPSCTIKSFPYAIEHTVQWARELFDELFVSPFLLAERFSAGDADVLSKLNDEEVSVPLKRVIGEGLVIRTFEDCVFWALSKFGQLFTSDIEELIRTHPKGQLTKQGSPFWSGSNRFPQSLHFDEAQTRHLDFIVAAANLIAVGYGKLTDDQIGNRVGVADILAKIYDKVKLSINDDSLLCRDLTANLTFHAAEFEKDDDSNFHVDFIFAAANLRAFNYSIEQADRMKCKQLAGSIIPALATTTTIVAGLVCLELYKFVQRHHESETGARRFCDYSLSLASPHFGVTSPELLLNAGAAVNNVWKRFVVRDKPNFGEMIDRLEKEHNFKISLVRLGDICLFNSMMEESEIANVRKMSIREICTSLGITFNQGTEAIRLDIADGDVLPLPFIQYEL